MKQSYDVLVIGPVSLDHNIDYQGNERKELGGAVVASGFAAAKSGNRTALFTKLNPADADVEARFKDSGADLFWKESRATCSIRNQYFALLRRRLVTRGFRAPFLRREVLVVFLPDICRRTVLAVIRLQRIRRIICERIAIRTLRILRSIRARAVPVIGRQIRPIRAC